MPKYTVASVRTLLTTQTLDLSHLTGITTFIQTVLCRNAPYRRPKGYTGTIKTSATRGLVMGRRLDRAFDNFYGKNKKKRPAPQCLNAVRTRLAHCGLSVCESQVPVGVRQLGLRTELDGLCVDKNGTIWIMELKNTQQTVEAHKNNYDLISPSCRVLRNGMANSERVKHALQVGFGMYAFLHCYKDVKSVRGIVLVNCTNGCVAYPIDFAVYGRKSHFAYSRRRAVVDAC
tara:strand:+ start:2963 stop:3655 length:693 start_codon:yes stop_codon:yes gene_type:complete